MNEYLKQSPDNTSRPGNIREIALLFGPDKGGHTNIRRVTVDFLGAGIIRLHGVIIKHIGTQSYVWHIRTVNDRFMYFDFATHFILLLIISICISGSHI